jgi:hypothetical protein
VSIPGSVTSIGELTFGGCSVLTSVTIPGSVIYIGSQAFYSCDALTSVIFGAGSNITTAWNDNAFPGNYGDNLWAAYTLAPKSGTYTRSGGTWTQTP